MQNIFAMMPTTENLFAKLRPRCQKKAKLKDVLTAEARSRDLEFLEI